MPDTTAPVWLPVATLFLGFVTSSFNELLRDKRTANREKQARHEKRGDDAFERHNSFQRSTLLELQEALFSLSRSTGALQFQYLMNHNNEKWHEQERATDLSENYRLAYIKAMMLWVRIDDEKIRELCTYMASHSAAAIDFPSKADEASKMENVRKIATSVAAMTQTLQQINHRAGEVLRELDRQISS